MKAETQAIHFHRCKKGARLTGRRGFTLIETLVSIMILSISLTVLMQIFSGGLHSAKLSKDYTKAVFIAGEKMEQLLLEEQLAPGTQSGAIGDEYTWVADIAQIDDGEIDGRLPVNRMIVSLVVHWKDGTKEKDYRLTTMTLQPKQIRMN